jgi:asparagine synthase (glutamine-hydrolysing)
MCGIFGLLGERSTKAESALRLGTQALAHRGPDDAGIEILPLADNPGQCVGLGARRLAIQDLSPAGHQPMQDPKTGNWLIFNGEIYNFHLIRSELEQLGHRFTSAGDTEVLLRAYAEWGEASLHKLAGMFAFAIWDMRKGRLFAVRDRLGVKPLYYYEAPGLFMFASELRSLLATGLIPRRLDEQAVASYLAFGSVQDPQTIVDGIRALPPGHTLVWEKAQIAIRPYWRLSDIATRPAATRSEGEAVEAIRPLLATAVSQRLISDVPVGVFLSGGVDSSSIVALTREVRTDPPDTFSVVFGDTKFCEADYSSKVAHAFGCHHHPIKLTEEKLLQEVPYALAAMDQPTVDGVNTYVVSQAVKQAGITVALSGVGGDEAFAGYSTSRAVPRMMAFQRYSGWLQLLGRGTSALLGPSRTNRLTKAAALAGGQYYGDHPYFLSRALFLPSTVRALLPSFSSRNGDLAGAWNLRALTESVRAIDPVNQACVLESSTYMANMLLRDTDCMSMFHSLEVRGPFLDHRLWECVLPLEGKLKLDPQRPKPLLLRAAGEKLPKEIYRRPKMGFTLPFDRWLRNGLAKTVERELSDSSPVEPLSFNSAEALKIWRAFLTGKTSWSRPWALYVLKRWIQNNIGDRR